jgi:hypothetical protein
MLAIARVLLFLACCCIVAAWCYLGDRGVRLHRRLTGSLVLVILGGCIAFVGLLAL